MSNLGVRALHLHTVDSLCGDLISGRPVGVGPENEEFSLSEPARAALDWYRRNPRKWTANVSQTDANALVDATAVAPPVLPGVAGRMVGAPARRLTLKRLTAHRFAGLHTFGLPSEAPPNFTFEFQSLLTLFEGLNGSGKTCLVNAIAWTLTGEMLRPQRAPEIGTIEFDCLLGSPDGAGPPSRHRLSSVTPLPEPATYLPADNYIPADTWVELVFVDEAAFELPPVRRTQSRTSRGKLEETVTGLDTLAVDPIALRLGIVMPGLLPFVQVGSTSELGRAVAELTGLSRLTDLADHASRAKRKIDNEFVGARESDIAAADEAYERARADLIAQIDSYPNLAPPGAVPAISADPTLEAALDELRRHFEEAKAKALEGARSVLGMAFDPTVAAMRADLESNVGPAIAEVRQLARQPSSARLAGLGRLSPEEMAAARNLRDKIIREAEILVGLSADASIAARTRLYARVADWLIEHPELQGPPDRCIVCGNDLVDARDPITSKLVSEHLAEAATTDSALLSQTLAHWASAAAGTLARDLTSVLQAELATDLPQHPRELIRTAIVDELFATAPFGGALQGLKVGTIKACDDALAGLPALPIIASSVLPAAASAFASLRAAIDRLDRALQFAEWRQSATTELHGAFRQIVSAGTEQPAIADPNGPLLARLQTLDSIVKQAAPITAALSACTRLREDLAKRRIAEHRLADYSRASAALTDTITIGDLVQGQVDHLRTQLQERAAFWRDRVYASAFPASGHGLVGTAMDSEGRLELLVGARGAAAPAQYIANASSLRATLVGFFLAFWEYVLRDRGGLRLLALDDPQEVLDEENRERLAHTLAFLVHAQTQLVVTTYDRRFAGLLAGLTRTSTPVDHRSLHPVGPTRSVLQTALSVSEIDRRQKLYDDDIDDSNAAREYASECRIFVEARLGDLFDDAAYPAWAATHQSSVLTDHLYRLRGLVKSPPSDLFRSPALKAVCDDPALADGAPALTLLNKAHHAQKHEIRPADVAAVSTDLARLRRLLEAAHEECRRWRRRECPDVSRPVFAPLVPCQKPGFAVKVSPDLAAFTRSAAEGESQADDSDLLCSEWFNDKTFFYLRCDNFGFAAPRGAIVVVEVEPSAVDDRRLVIARSGERTFARRLLRTTDSGFVSLGAETPDPRRSPPSLQAPDVDLALHRVVGVLFDDRIRPPRGKDEVVAVDLVPVLERIEAAYRIREDSAVPLALPGQLVLGARNVALSDFDQHEGGLVALCLNDGSSMFKRVASRLPGSLGHLRQFDSVGGLGASQIFSVGPPQPGLKTVLTARRIVGVLYNA
jgi:AAA domain